MEQPGGFEDVAVSFVDSAYLTLMVNCNIKPWNLVTRVIVRAIAPDR